MRSVVGLRENQKQKEMERQQVLKSLVIPVSGLADAQREINTPGSAMNLIYGKVKTK